MHKDCTLWLACGHEHAAGYMLVIAAPNRQWARGLAMAHLVPIVRDAKKSKNQRFFGLCADDVEISETDANHLYCKPQVISCVDSHKVMEGYVDLV